MKRIKHTWLVSCSVLSYWLHENHYIIISNSRIMIKLPSTQQIEQNNTINRCLDSTLLLHVSVISDHHQANRIEWYKVESLNHLRHGSISMTVLCIIQSYSPDDGRWWPKCHNKVLCKHRLIVLFCSICCVDGNFIIIRDCNNTTGCTPLK
jgi:hypothetical protein